ncbi:hypothetical protein FDJ34_gp49 [Microbacterium phage Eleri]|uniref:Uncharacterized protein n=1 Tax=Microbacterium phage Eleri TaxID=2079581 RepID=A0A2L0HNT9_9CAUD|nr:hypothetical protein FDJ34_gp49 [Microbacterium phage Eleri]AUX83387.1 hypothetical protein SEA_ELERI_49 [Microbacterium phage Eleri]
MTWGMLGVLGMAFGLIVMVLGMLLAVLVMIPPAMDAIRRSKIKRWFPEESKEGTR